MQKAVMEFIGAFFFILTIILTGNPIAIASMLMAWVYIGGYISGAHYNPAVTLAVTIAKKWDWAEAAKYIIAQILGAFAAFAMAFFLTGKNTIALPLLGKDITLAQVFVMEALLTFVLALVILVVTTHKFKESKIFGAAIGFTIPALVLLGGPISGGIFNPAIILGGALATLIKGGIGWEAAALYVPAQLLGGALAACAFKYLNLDHHNIDNH